MEMLTPHSSPHLVEFLASQGCPHQELTVQAAASSSLELAAKELHPPISSIACCGLQPRTRAPESITHEVHDKSSAEERGGEKMERKEKREKRAKEQENKREEKRREEKRREEKRREEKRREEKE